MSGLSREVARQIIWNYIYSPERNSAQLFEWELKFPLGHPENTDVVESILDRLQKIGLVQPEEKS